jgi:hypothetical protein
MKFLLQMGGVFRPKLGWVRVSSEVMENTVKRVLGGQSERPAANGITWKKKLIEVETTDHLLKKNQKSSHLAKCTHNRKNIIVDTSSSDEDDIFSLHDESEYEDEVCKTDEQEDMPLLLDDLKLNDFVLVQFVKCQWRELWRHC